MNNNPTPNQTSSDELNEILEEYGYAIVNHPEASRTSLIRTYGQAIRTKYISRAEHERELIARCVDEVTNAKVVHMDMHHGDRGEFDRWCTKRQEDIKDGRPAEYGYNPQANS